MRTDIPTTPKPFLSEDFLLQTDTARYLYHEHAARMPIIDYHCHLPPDQIAADQRFPNLTRIWLDGDHYKWRAMRTNGVPERFITGDADDFARFQQWAQTVPYTMRNPLYHWTHLELRRYFGITKVLDGDTSREIYDEATALLQSPDYSVRGLLTRMNVRVVCTTDDPTDSLEYHRQIRKVAFRSGCCPPSGPTRA
jgi:glucuronate isomerase